jgi:hypothetical protein
MLKRIIGQETQVVAPSEPQWFNVDALAPVEVSSEEAEHPGPQTVRLVFDQPQRIKRLHLEFHEDGLQRTQQFVLRWFVKRRAILSGNRASAV